MLVYFTVHRNSLRKAVPLWLSSCRISSYSWPLLRCPGEMLLAWASAPAVAHCRNSTCSAPTGTSPHVLPPAHPHRGRKGSPEQGQLWPLAFQTNSIRQELYPAAAEAAMPMRNVFVYLADAIHHVWSAKKPFCWDVQHLHWKSLPTRLDWQILWCWQALRQRQHVGSHKAEWLMWCTWAQYIYLPWAMFQPQWFSKFWNFWPCFLNPSLWFGSLKNSSGAGSSKKKNLIFDPDLPISITVAM